MKRFFLTTSVLAIVIAACNNKMAPNKSGNTTKAQQDAKTQQDIKTVNTTTVADTAAAINTNAAVTNNLPMADLGKTVFTSRCGRCHELKNPGNWNATQWDGILKSMAPKAKLNADETNQVLAYVKANAKS